DHAHEHQEVRSSHHPHRVRPRRGGGDPGAARERMGRAGAQGGGLRAEILGLHGGGAFGGGFVVHHRPAHGREGAGPQTRRRGDRPRVHLGVHRQRDRVRGREARVLRRGPGHLQHRRGAGGGAGDRPYGGDPARPPLRAVRRHARGEPPGGEARAVGGGRRRLRVRRVDRRAARGDLWGCGVLLLPPAQVDHHGRGRHGHDRGRPARACLPQPARSRRHPLRPPAAPRGGGVPPGRVPRRGIQLPDDRHPGRPRLGADGPRRLDPGPAPRHRRRVRRAAGRPGVAGASRRADRIHPRVPELRDALPPRRAHAAQRGGAARPAERADDAPGGDGDLHPPGHPRAGAPGRVPRPLRTAAGTVSQRGAGRPPLTYPSRRRADDGGRRGRRGGGTARQPRL
ncbi:MAG: DegT/DnrJ/EryC1/StrS aminotransferase, partial [uncultured Gemmatimonadetes bacterium]